MNHENRAIKYCPIIDKYIEQMEFDVNPGDIPIYGWYLQKSLALHCETGPAVYNEDLSLQEWYFSGKRIECVSQEEFDKYLKMKMFW